MARDKQPDPHRRSNHPGTSMRQVGRRAIRRRQKQAYRDVQTWDVRAILRSTRKPAG